jgi:uncharacterized membrane protein
MNNAELRARARMNLGGSLFHSDWLTALAVCLVGSIIVNAISILSIILTGPVSFGLAVIFLKKVRGGGPIQFGDLFLGFDRFGETLVVGLMQWLIPFLWSLIPIAGIYFGIKKYYSYALAMYVKVDYPDAPWRECLDRSNLLMEGFRWKLFCLQFSFVGWMIVGALCCGVGTLWVTPYMNASTANFYEARRMEGGAY